jgi:hypothetical protein
MTKLRLRDISVRNKCTAIVELECAMTSAAGNSFYFETNGILAVVGEPSSSVEHVIVLSTAIQRRYNL